ncbi:hypothetical protein Poly59_23750 [Rubripirellula reticaptiva]|uniref:Uncharacterized protein n=1 Tax=Rubripirellula reticaptiva TaxID=2528013 RepID=A0A5C6F9A5_9BACT|nr:hypothetical protein Poly59_23750 [Rubripirellula reticaptiva]
MIGEFPSGKVHSLRKKPDFGKLYRLAELYDERAHGGHQATAWSTALPNCSNLRQTG